MKDKIYLSPPHMGGGEMKFIKEAFDSNWISPVGPNISGFENDLCKYTGAEYAVALSSGTAAIHLALNLLDVKPSDEVICPSFTFAGSVFPVLYQKAVPVFVDSENKTWNMDPGLLEEAIDDRIKEGKKPKAVILVHLYGMPAQLTEIIEIAEKYRIPVIEDAAEALGAKYHDRHVGTFAELGILSFNGNKMITTSGGGALLTKRKEYAEKTRFLATQARDEAPHYEHTEMGFNYRMSNIAAGIGRGQMEIVAQHVERRREIFDLYKNELEDSGIQFLKEPAGFYANRWLTCGIFKETAQRDKVMQSLNNKNIESRPLWKPMHLQPLFQNNPFYGENTSENFFKKGLCFPSGSALTQDQLHYIVDLVKSSLNS